MNVIEKHRHQVAVVGAGLAGLICGIELAKEGIDFCLYDTADAPGGRIRTDQVGELRLDRGFQVYLRAYPEGRRYLDYDALDLRDFIAGAAIRLDNGFTRVADPRRHRTVAINSLLSDVGSLSDKLKVLRLVQQARRGKLSDVFTRPELSTIARLRQIGFSDKIIERFFRPFLGGIFLDKDLLTSSRMLDFVLRMMAEGPVSLPNMGMEEIPKQLAAKLPAESIQLNSPVAEVAPNRIVLADGKEIHADAVVLAVDASSAARLLPGALPPRAERSVTCLYYVSEHLAFPGRWLVLNGTGKGLINNLCIPNDFAHGYGPWGSFVTSVTVLDRKGMNDEQLETAVREELKQWFGGAVRKWRHVRTYTIRHALPAQPLHFVENLPKPLVNGVILAGDHTTNASINGAMASGRRAAQLALKMLDKTKNRRAA